MKYFDEQINVIYKCDHYRNLKNSEKQQEDNKIHPPALLLSGTCFQRVEGRVEPRRGQFMRSEGPEAWSLGAGWPLGFGGRRGGLSEPRHPLPCPGVPQPIWDQVRTVWPTDLCQRLGAAGARQCLPSGLLCLLLLQAPAVHGRGVWLGRGEGAVPHPLRHHDREPQEGRRERYPTLPPSIHYTSAPSLTPPQPHRNCLHSSRVRCLLYHLEAAHGASFWLPHLLGSWKSVPFPVTLFPHL